MGSASAAAIFVREGRRRTGRMRRAVKRRVFTASALLSALLFAWACWAWARSHQPRHLVVEAGDGRLFLIFWESPGQPLNADFHPGADFARDADVLWREVIHPVHRGWERMGFGFARGHTPSIPVVQIIAVPFWFIVTLTAVIPVAWLTAVRRRRSRARENRCMNCGYDLRASAERCPECGTAVATGAASA